MAESNRPLHGSETPQRLERRRRRDRRSPRWTRRLRKWSQKVKWGTFALVLVAAIAVAFVGVAALLVDSDNRIDSALTSLNRVMVGLSDSPTFTQADVDRLVSGIRDLETNLGTARQRFSLLGPLPNLNNQLAATAIQLEAAHDLTRAASTMLNGLQPTLFFLVSGDSDDQVLTQISSGERIVEQLAVGRGQFLQASEFLAASRAALDRLRLETLSPDLVLATDDLETYYEQLQQANTILLKSPELLNNALGLDEERSYLILSQNSDELRPSGGYISTYGWLTVRNGRVIDYSYFPTTVDTPNPPPPAALEDFDIPSWWIRYSEPLFAAWDGSWYADFPSTAALSMQYYDAGSNPQSPVDGVLAIDIFGFEKVLAALGRVPVPGYEEVVTTETFRDLVYDIRASVEGDNPHKAFIADVYQAIFDGWQAASADPEISTLVLSEMLGALQQKHVMLYFADEGLNDAVTMLGWTGQQAPAADHDYVMVADANLGNKSNRSILRQLTYDVDIQPDGTLNSRLAIGYDYSDRLASQDPAVNPAKHGPLNYRNLLQVFTPANSQLESTNNLNREPQVISEANFTQFISRVLIEYDSSERFQFSYQTPTLVEQIGPYQRYRLLVQKQPGTAADPVNVQIALPVGASTVGISPDPAASYDLEQPTLEFRLDLQTDRWIEITYQLAETP